LTTSRQRRTASVIAFYPLSNLRSLRTSVQKRIEQLLDEGKDETDVCQFLLGFEDGLTQAVEVRM
jgi:hypothetical protein